MPSRNSYSPLAIEAARVLGGRIRLARHARGWTIAELAERVGVNRNTMQKVEAGDPSVRLGVALEAAVVTGVPLFDADLRSAGIEAAGVRQQLALLPARSRPLPTVDDDF